jgi:hypothetical protein
MALVHNTNSIVTNGLVLALDAANPKSYSGSGATTWSDLSGNGNNATLTGSPTYVSANSGSIAFNGSNQYSTVSNNITSGTGDFAVSIWVYKTEMVANRYIWDFGSNGAVLASGTSNGPGFRYYNPTIGLGSPLYTSGPIHNINTWYNIVISRISGTTYFYSNGSLIVSAADSGNIGSWGTTLTVGGYGGGGYYHQGNISNFLVYKNKGLTAAEVSQNYNALRGRYVTITPNIVTSGLVLNLDAGNLASYYGAGTTWSDLSGNGRNGTLQGSPSYNAANGGSLVFNGSNQFVSNTLPNLGISGNAAITLSCWFYTSASSFATLLSYGGGAVAAGDTFSLIVDANGVISVHFNGGNGTLSSSNVFLPNTWNNFTATKTPGAANTTTKLYLNGIELTISSSTTITPNFIPYVLNVGRWVDATYGYFYPGRISQASVYNRALSAAEVSQNYNALKGRYV